MTPPSVRTLAALVHGSFGSVTPALEQYVYCSNVSQVFAFNNILYILYSCKSSLFVCFYKIRHPFFFFFYFNLCVLFLPNRSTDCNFCSILILFFASATRWQFWPIPILFPLNNTSKKQTVLQHRISFSEPAQQHWKNSAVTVMTIFQNVNVN